MKEKYFTANTVVFTSNAKINSGETCYFKQKQQLGFKTTVYKCYKGVSWEANFSLLWLATHFSLPLNLSVRLVSSGMLSKTVINE